VLTYSLAQVRAFLAAAERRDRRATLRAALAARAAQADAPGWRRFCRTFDA